MTVPQNVKLARHPIDLDDDGHEYVELGVTTETDTTQVLAPDGTGGVEWVTGSTGGGVTGFATPAIVLGTAAAAGAATTVIRSDSTVVAFDATVPVTQAFGDTAATGSAAFAARRDHRHGMPATPVVTGGELVIETGTSSPPVPIWNSDGDDFVYSSS